MDLTQLIVFAIASIGLFLTIGCFLYMARSDYRHLDAKLDAIRDLTHAIHGEMVDFHKILENQDRAFRERIFNVKENIK